MSERAEAAGPPPRRSGGFPFPTRRALEQLHLAAHGIPIGTGPDDQLGAIIRHAGGISTAYDQRHNAAQYPAKILDKHFPNLDAHLIASVQPESPPLKKFLLPLCLALAIFAAYAPALRNDFVWDDTALILRDPLIRSWQLIPEAFQHFLFIDATPSDEATPLRAARRL